jgi:hypothetical protein
MRFVSNHAEFLRNNLLDFILHSSYVLSMFHRRLGPDPHAHGAQTFALSGCPDIWELDTGEFAVIGTDITELAGQLPVSASCGPDERIIKIPRKTLVLAKPDIPEHL